MEKQNGEVQYSDQATGCEIWGSNSGRHKDICIFYKKRLDRPWGPIQPPRQIVPEFFYVGHEVGHTSPSSTEVKNEWSCAPDPPTYLRGMGRDQV